MKYKNYIKLAALLPLLALLGCEANETPGAENQETVPVTIRLGLEKDGLSTRADDDDTNTSDDIDDSKITSLDVYIMNGSTVEKHLIWEQFTDNLANDIELTTGTKQVYAIANYSDAPDNYVENIAVDALSQIGSCIPMSADTTWTINSAGTYEVELVRMVAKMQVSIVQDDGETETTKSSISNFKIEKLLPTQTMLYRNDRSGSNLPNITLPTNVTMEDWTWNNPTIGSAGTEFYLHETTGTFRVSLQDGDRERFNTFTVDIPRNYKLPLIIHLSDHFLGFTGSTYEHAPIGVLPNPVNINGYTIELPSGASAVNLKIGLKQAGEGSAMNNVTWTCNISQTGTLPSLENIDTETESGVLTVLSNYDFPAGLTGTITLTLTATFTEDGESKTIPFTVTINVKKIEEVNTRSASQAPQPIIIEL